MAGPPAAPARGWRGLEDCAVIEVKAGQSTGSSSTEGGAIGDCVVIEVNYMIFLRKTGRTLWECAITLIAGQSTGNFSTEAGGAVPKTVYVAEGAYTIKGLTRTETGSAANTVLVNSKLP
jgi:hypothetical protein